eukprot:1330218-Amorphochlora_amoeboformis.AAC.1
MYVFRFEWVPSLRPEFSVWVSASVKIRVTPMHRKADWAIDVITTWMGGIILVREEKKRVYEKG